MVPVPRTLADAAERFVGRQWLLPLVDSWLAHSDSTFLILTGDPGVGKSMICAWLAGSGPVPDDSASAGTLVGIRTRVSATFWCGKRHEGASVDPHTFVSSIAEQLSDSDVRFAQAAAEAIPTSYRVDMTVGINAGEIVGIRTNNLWVAGVTTAHALSIAVKEPIRRLARSAPSKSFLVVVDGLDESLTYGLTSIPELIASFADLSPNLRIILTTKRDSRILGMFPPNSGTSIIDLSADERRGQIDADLRIFWKSAMQRIGDKAPERAGNLLNVEALLSASRGNFQYASSLLDDLQAGRSFTNDPVSLPAGLLALYASYFRRFVPQLGEYGQGHLWMERYARVIGPLAVAQCPIRLRTLADVAGVKLEGLLAVLHDFQQLICISNAPEPTVSFYHGSIADFLTTPLLDAGEINPFFLAPSSLHLQYVEHYLDIAATSSWHACDDYGLEFIATHLRELAEREQSTHYTRCLYRVILDPEYNDSALSRESLPAGALTQAYSVAIGSAQTREDPPALVRIVNNCLSVDSAALNSLGTATLVELSNDRPEVATGIMIAALSDGSRNAIASCMVAVYRIGLKTSKTLEWVVLHGSDELRQLAAYVVYLLWTAGERTTVSSFFAEIADRIRAWRPVQARRILNFLSNASITMYISRCHDHDLIIALNTLWFEQVRQKLPFTALNKRLTEGVLVRSAVGGTLSRRLIAATLMTEIQPSREFFQAPAEVRDLFAESITLIGPDIDLRCHSSQLRALHESPILLLRILGGIVVASHAVRERLTLQPFLEEQAQQLTPSGRLWQLLSFISLFPMDPGWHEFIETETAALINEREVLVTQDNGQLGNFYIALMPYGSSCGKNALQLQVVRSALDRSLRRGDFELASALIENLGVVGFYYPDTVLSEMIEVASSFENRIFLGAVARALGRISVLSPTKVDQLLEEAGRGDLREEVRASVDLFRVQRDVDRIGFYNNVVNQTAMHPIMRDRLVVPSLQILAYVASEEEYIRRYTRVSLRLLRESNYRVVDWMG